MVLKSIGFPFAYFSLLMLTACGGGGSSSVKTSIPSGFDFKEGNASTETAARSALQNAAAMSLPYTAPDSTTYSSLNMANISLNGSSDPIASRDTSADEAWEDGWTGLGVTVGVVDEFNSNGQVDSHGDWVTIVVNSVAPEATLDLRNISTGDGVLSIQAALAAFDLLEQAGVPIINNSWGTPRSATYNIGFDNDVAALVADFEATSTDAVDSAGESIDGLFVWAAGNNAVECESLVASRRIEDCELFAAYVAGIRDNGNVVAEDDIWVGALADGSNTMANYSLQAGDLKNDFIVAHDDVLASGDAAGTSFAAPRVAGAAALVKQKFPNLTSKQLKRVLLETATDLGASGVDDVYGYGKLNIERALSPIGSLSD